MKKNVIEVFQDTYISIDVISLFRKIDTDGKYLLIINGETFDFAEKKADRDKVFDEVKRQFRT